MSLNRNEPQVAVSNHQFLIMVVPELDISDSGHP